MHRIGVLSLLGLLIVGCRILDLKESVGRKWSKFVVQGQPIFSVKEKLKLLNIELKRWNKEVFGDVVEKKKLLIQQFNDLDIKAEDINLSLDEAKVRQDALSEL